MSIVFVAPEPEAVTPDPVKLSVVAVVVSGLPSSWTVTPAPPPIRRDGDWTTDEPNLIQSK
jgi:hypothetical protein